MSRKHSILLSLLTFAAFVAGCGDKNEQPKGNNPAQALEQMKQGAQNPAMAAEMKKEAVAVRNLPKGDPNAQLEKFVDLKSGGEVATLYYAISGLPVDYEKLAPIMSREYRETSDGFKKQEILQALKPRIDASINEAKKNSYYVVDTDIQLQHYDFSTKSFPVNGVPDKNGSIYFFDSSEYRIGFNNGDEFKSYKVDDSEKAKQIESLVAKYQASGKAKLYLFAQDTDSNSRQVKFQIVRVVMSGKEGLQINF